MHHAAADDLGVAVHTTSGTKAPKGYDNNLVLFLPPAQCKQSVTQWAAGVKICDCQVRRGDLGRRGRHLGRDLAHGRRAARAAALPDDHRRRQVRGGCAPPWARRGGASSCLISPWLSWRAAGAATTNLSSRVADALAQFECFPRGGGLSVSSRGSFSSLGDALKSSQRRRVPREPPPVCLPLARGAVSCEKGGSWGNAMARDM